MTPAPEGHRMTLSLNVDVSVDLSFASVLPGLWSYEHADVIEIKAILHFSYLPTYPAHPDRTPPSTPLVIDIC